MFPQLELQCRKLRIHPLGHFLPPEPLHPSDRMDLYRMPTLPRPGSDKIQRHVVLQSHTGHAGTWHAGHGARDKSIRRLVTQVGLCQGPGNSFPHLQRSTMTRRGSHHQVSPSRREQGVKLEQYRPALDNSRRALSICSIIEHPDHRDDLYIGSVGSSPTPSSFHLPTGLRLGEKTSESHLSWFAVPHTRSGLTVRWDVADECYEEERLLATVTMVQIAASSCYTTEPPAHIARADSLCALRR